MNILLVNDDGIKSPGILLLADALSKNHNVTVVAPDKENSGKGHSYSTGPLNYAEIDTQAQYKAYSINGTPVDCVKFGIDMILQGKKPDLILSGINNDHNVACTVLYSGTINAALVGIEFFIPAIAISIGSKSNKFEYPVEFIEKNLSLLYSLITDTSYILSVNIPTVPKEKIKGVRFTKIASASYRDYYKYESDNPKGAGYYVYGNMFYDKSQDGDTDCELLFDDYITITPIKCEFTYEKKLNELKSIRIPL